VDKQDLAQEQPVDWVDAESDTQEFRTELQRLKRRAQKRPGLLLFLCLLGVAAVLWKVSKRVPVYQATIVMRVTEGVVVEEESPVVRQGLAHYLYTVALNSERLLPIIEEFDLFPQRETFGDPYAVDELRNTLDIEVGINHFARERDDGDPVRSAGIVIHYSSNDAARAFDVARALSAALVDAEQERRGQMAQKLNAIAGTSLERVESRLASLKEDLATTMLKVNAAKTKPVSALERTRLDMRSRRLIASVTQTELVLERVSGTRDDTVLAIAAEGANQALRFDIVDVRPPVVAPKTSLVAYGLIGLLVFLCLVPISAIGVAAMDSRLHHIEDLVRLGLPVVGHMPSFPSDRMGSMQERSRQAKDVA
jgi:hypothetical protein